MSEFFLSLQWKKIVSFLTIITKLVHAAVITVPIYLASPTNYTMALYSLQFLYCKDLYFQGLVV